MLKFLIDVNLPFNLSIWNSQEFIHQKNINDEWKDSQIWQYAMDNNLTIITKDMDFSNKILFHNPPPKVIHIRYGNMKTKPFYDNISVVWEQIIEMNSSHKLVNVFADRIEGLQ
jgi:predicted nuclease of predicted toxin-antitoxin system